ncbi:helix-turn-helix domain-containing protein [Streptomyces bobili]|uniref:helix-turn-helix domain-containing protein n=1 Tax=Streptomyces bobili TaxID=67280 RepID=UPI003433FAC4
MPPKKRVDLPDHVRAAVLGEVQMDVIQATAAEERSKIRIYLATEQGLTTYEIAEKLGIPQQTVSRWARQGREAWERREPTGDQRSGEDPVRSGELEPLS